MAFCGKCGTRADEGVKFCPSCGAAMASQSQPSDKAQPEQNDLSERLQNFNNTADTTADFDPTDIEQNKVMAILAYLSWLVIIPIFAAKESKFARFHANQGLVLAICEIAYGIAYGILSSVILAISWKLYFLVSIIGLVSFVFLVVAVLGIVNAAGGRAKELPIIGKFRILK